MATIVDAAAFKIDKIVLQIIVNNRPYFSKISGIVISGVRIRTIEDACPGSLPARIRDHRLIITNDTKLDNPKEKEEQERQNNANSTAATPF